MHIARFVRIALCACTLAATAALAADSHMPDVTRPATVERPTFDVNTFAGTPFSLAAQRGKWVLVVYWASWCRPCTRALPVVAQFAHAHPDVSTIGLAVVEPQREKPMQYAAAHPVDMPLAWLDKPQTQKLLGQIVGIPVTWLIAPDGTLRESWMGGFDAAQLDQLMVKAGYPKAQ